MKDRSNRVARLQSTGAQPAYLPRWRALLRLGLVLFLVLVLGDWPYRTTPALAQGQVYPQNVIILIGDGMGFEQVKAAGMYLNGEEGTLSFEQMPYQAEVTTHASGGAVTDSAAAATALATGAKVNNGVISLAIPGDGSELETTLEFYKAQGKSVGLVSTTYMTHATPAAFAAHETSRSNLSPIAGDYLNQTRPNVLFGGGGNGMSESSAAAAGYTVVVDRAEMQALDADQVTMVSGQFGASHLPYEYDGSYTTLPHLTEMTSTALDILDVDPDGLFLMVEGGRIDHAGHANNLERNILETKEFADAVQIVMDWAEGRSDTLVIVTADHETGGLAVVENNGKDSFPTVSWSTTGHTGASVPIYASGFNADLISGVMDNTDIHVLSTSTGASPASDGLAAVASSQTQIDLTWQDNVPDETAFHIEHSVAGSTDWTEIDTVTAGTTSYRDNGLDCGFAHYYRVRAYWSGVDQYSAYSNVAQDTTPLCETARTLAPGWNLASWRVQPPDPSVATVLASIDGLYCRVLSATGVYDCGLDPVYHTLEELPGAASYYLRLEDGVEAELQVPGYAIPGDTPLPLSAGWNWIGYLPDTILPIGTALASIDGRYDLVHSLSQTYFPGDPVHSTLTHMEPGQGYMIHATQATSLVYPSGAGLAQSADTGQDLASCNDLAPTPTFTLVYGKLAAGDNPAPLGTVVEVLTPRGEVAGCSVLRHKGQYGFMHVYGEDPTDPPIPGFREGERLAFRVNGVVATASTELGWVHDLTPAKVDLAVESVSSKMYLPLIVAGE